MSPRTAESTDPNGVDTTTVYDSNDLYPVHIYEASNRSSEQRSWTLSHQFQTGLLLSRTDDNNGVTSGFDYEPLGRPEKVTEAGMRETNTVYDDESLAVLVKADLDTMADGKLTTVRHFDPLWRVRLERTTDGTPLTLSNDETGIKVQRRYHTVTGARYELVSNPYRAPTSGAASSEETMGWTRTKRDTGITSRLQASLR